MFKINNKDTRTTLLASVWCLYSYLWTYFTSCSSVSVVNFEHVIAGVVKYFNSPKLWLPQSINQRKMTPSSHNKLENGDLPQVIMTRLISIVSQWRVNINWWKRTPLKPLHCNSNCNIRFFALNPNKNNSSYYGSPLGDLCENGTPFRVGSDQKVSSLVKNHL